MTDQIVSPFDSSEDGRVATYSPTEASELNQDEILELTEANVELVLDEMRPYLIQDGGNVAIAEIDGPVVRLELQVCNKNMNHPYNNNNNNEQRMLKHTWIL
jgi:lysyl-tRNA synthetase class 2